MKIIIDRVKIFLRLVSFLDLKKNEQSQELTMIKNINLRSIV